jgi:hypothetical protein
MSVVNPTFTPMPLRELWARAPLWRIAAILASALTFLFLLFPPKGSDPRQAQSLADAASFDPTAAFGPDASAASAAVVSTAAPPAAPDAYHTNVAARIAVPSIHPAVASAISATRPAAPKSALLSMVSAGPGDMAGGTGLASAMTGPLYSGSITSDGFTLPLPPGRWAVLARTTAHTATASGMAYYLGRIENRRLVGVVDFIALRNGPSAAGFPKSELCAHIDPQRLFVSVEGPLDPTDHQACWSISSYYAQSLGYWADNGMPLDGLERAAGGDLAAKGVSYPQDMVQVRFTRSDRSQFLEANYLFSPETSGIVSHQAPSALDSDWAAANVVHFPLKLAYLAKIQAWGQGFWPRFEAAFAQGAGATAS